jgi:Patatin-like phospholipase
MGAAVPDARSTSNPSSDQDPALTLAQVLWDERHALEGSELPSAQAAGNFGCQINGGKIAFCKLGAKHLPAIYGTLNKDNRWALCLSGGGIRSAAFSLGLMQRFAQHHAPAKWNAQQTEPLLQQFDYLSTVSGGGYVGSWFSAWLYHERLEETKNDKDQTIGRDEAGKDQKTPRGASAVLKNLYRSAGDHDEAAPITNLRRDSHYLAPSFSAISPDVWASIATVVRNLAMNWILLVPPMILAILATQTLGYGFVDALTVQNGTLIYLTSILAAILIAASSAFAAANLPTRGLTNRTQPQFLVFDLALFIGGAGLLTFVLASHNGRVLAKEAAVGLASIVYLRLEGATAASVLVEGAVLGSGLYLASWFIAGLFKLVRGNTTQPTPQYKFWHTIVGLGAWGLAGSAFGAIASAGYLIVLWISATFPALRNANELGSFLGVCGVPWLLGARIIADIVAVAPTQFIPRSDADLEYQARAGGILALAQVGWLAWFGLVLFGSTLAEHAAKDATTWLVSVGGISGAVALAIGSSSKTAGAVRAVAKARQYLGLNTLAAIAAAIFAAVLVVMLSAAVSHVMALSVERGELHPAWGITSFVGASLFIGILISSLIININRFSLHGLYRNRLVRAFLGASRSEKERDLSKNHFTDFDSADSPCLHELWKLGVRPCGDAWRPLHIINAAVNLVSSKNLAWQERMAAPFTFSPLHCGSGSPAFQEEGAFRRSYPLGERKPYGGRYGVTLGTAMAISGAAVSPNMGYNSSPGVAFLMTLFNVRLGWWLGNPRGNKLYYYTGPKFALRPLFMEMFGLTSENERWVYLSDGGHFENLGLYEMVRRRCRVIVVSDAGCDPDYDFEDLGNAVRKIWIDLGVRIDFVGLDRLKKRFMERPTPATDEAYWAVGRVRYTLADGKGHDGWLLYLKSGIHGTEPMDVLSYAVSHRTFPHETTANQFFSESQFESYRALGHEIAGKALDYANRERDAVAPPAGSDSQAAPAKGGSAPKSSMTLVEVIEHLEAQLKKSVSKPP